MSNFVYILQSEKDNSYYIGYTQDIAERLKRHSQGRSRYTQNKRPWKLVYGEEFPDKTSALKRENYLKRQKNGKLNESLVRTQRNTDDLLSHINNLTLDVNIVMRYYTDYDKIISRQRD